MSCDTGLNSSSRSSCRLFSANRKTRESHGRPCLQGPARSHRQSSLFFFFFAFYCFFFFFRFRRRVLRLVSEMLPDAACKYLPRTLQQSPADRGLKGRGAESVCVAPAVIAASADPRDHPLLVLLVVSCPDFDEALWFARKNEEKKKSSCGKK